MMNEKRLIDFSLIRSKAFADPDSGEAIVYLQDIDEILAVDAMEVVYCKDCTRFDRGHCTIRKDSWGGYLSRGYHDFCSDGERRTYG